MNEMRSLIQAKLEEIQDIEISAEVPDDIIETNKTYFSFSLRKVYVNSDTDKNFTYKIFIEGFIKRKVVATENTLLIMDSAIENIETKLKDLNIKTSFDDVSVLDNIKKTKVYGSFIYNELNNGII